MLRSCEILCREFLSALTNAADSKSISFVPSAEECVFKRTVVSG